MRNLLSPDIYEKLIARRNSDPFVQQLLIAWDRQGGLLTDFLATAVLGMSEQNEKLMEQNLKLLAMAPGHTFIITDKAE